MSNAVKVIREVADEIMPYAQEHIPDELWTRLWGKLRGAANDVETELSAAQAALENDRLKLAGCSCASWGAWKEGDSLHENHNCPAIHDVARLYTKWAKAQAKLAKFEQAKIPEEPERLTFTRELVSGGVATEVCVAAHKYDALKTFAAAQKVRADENERDATLYQLARFGKLHELVPVKDAAKALEAKGIAIEIPSPRQQSLPAFDTEAMKREREKQEERQERELELRRRVFAQIHAKWKGQLKRDDLAQVAARLLVYGATQTLGALYTKQPALDKMSEGDLSRLIALLAVYECVDNLRPPAPLFDMAKRLKIDPAKIKKELAAEARVKAKGIDDGYNKIAAETRKLVNESRAKDKPAAAAQPAKKKPGK